jgi:hypothetical protein
MAMTDRAMVEVEIEDCSRCKRTSGVIGESKFGQIRQCRNVDCGMSYLICKTAGPPFRFHTQASLVKWLSPYAATAALEAAIVPFLEQRQRDREQHEREVKAKADREKAAAAEKKFRICPENDCGRFREPVTNSAAAFCGNCGTKIEEIPARSLWACLAMGCTELRKPADPEDSRCVGCGGKLHHALPEDLRIDPKTKTVKTK